MSQMPKLVAAEVADKGRLGLCDMFCEHLQLRNCFMLQIYSQGMSSNSNRHGYEI